MDDDVTRGLRREDVVECVDQGTTELREGQRYQVINVTVSGCVTVDGGSGAMWRPTRFRLLFRKGDVVRVAPDRERLSGDCSSLLFAGQEARVLDLDSNSVRCELYQGGHRYLTWIAPDLLTVVERGGLRLSSTDESQDPLSPEERVCVNCAVYPGRPCPNCKPQPEQGAAEPEPVLRPGWDHVRRQEEGILPGFRGYAYVRGDVHVHKSVRGNWIVKWRGAERVCQTLDEAMTWAERELLD